MPQILDIHRDGDCLWVKVCRAEGDIASSPEVHALRSELDQSGVRRLIVDLSPLTYFGSTLLELLVVLWRKVGRDAGRLVIYKPSPIGREVLASSRLEQIWPIADSPQEALRLARAAEDSA